MTVTTDEIALNQWVACAWDGQVAVASSYDTVILGQPIRLNCNENGSLSCTVLDEDGNPGRSLPLQTQYTCVFTTLGNSPRPLPEIAEFFETDRKITGCGSVGVSTSPYRLIENFLDMAHFSFVHTDILGSADNTEVPTYRAEHRKDVDEVWAIDCTFFQPAASKSAAENGEGQLTHYQYRVMSPFSVMLYKTVYNDPDRMDAICVFIQPITETKCLAYMPMSLVDEESSVAGLIDFQQTIFLQDRIILENQRPALFPLDPKTEIPGRADISSITFRRWLKEMGIRFGIHEMQAV